ncbi:MAG TPA: DUF896 domain-containing protein [Bacilli bacterium]
MEFAQMVERINELARKQKSVGLTPEETSERDMLRRRYIESFKRSVKAQLDSIRFADEQDSAHAKRIQQRRRSK